MKNTYWYLFLTIFIFVIIFEVYFINQYQFQKDASEINNSVSNQISSSELHYSTNNLTYSFVNEDVCGKIEPLRVRRAFREISNQTNFILSFTEINGTADIEINCSKSVPAGMKEGYIIAGEGAYYSQGTLITHGALYFYNCLAGSYAPGCSNFPDVEIHEILHTFGIGHNNNSSSIMIPEYNRCKYQIDQDIINKLKLIYS